jgi:hypothetical protein
VKALALAARVALSGFMADVRAGLAEKLTATAFLAGWLLITDAIARLPHVSPAIAWRLSLGLLGIALGGVKLFALFAWKGLYELTRDDDVGGKG